MSPYTKKKNKKVTSLDLSRQKKDNAEELGSQNSDSVNIGEIKNMGADDANDSKDKDDYKNLTEEEIANLLLHAPPKPLPRLSYEKRGWNAPLDQPYVPVGRMTELVTAMEKVRENLPHTRERFKKQTYRQMLMVKKRERDLADKLKKHR